MGVDGEDAALQRDDDIRAAQAGKVHHDHDAVAVLADVGPGTGARGRTGHARRCPSRPSPFCDAVEMSCAIVSILPPVRSLRLDLDPSRRTGPAGGANDTPEHGDLQVCLQVCCPQGPRAGPSTRMRRAIRAPAAHENFGRRSSVVRTGAKSAGGRSGDRRHRRDAIASLPRPGAPAARGTVVDLRRRRFGRSRRAVKSRDLACVHSSRREPGERQNGCCARRAAPQIQVRPGRAAVAGGTVLADASLMREGVA